MNEPLVRQLFAAVILVACGSTFAAGDAARGQRLYEARCSACHSLDANRVGPAHRGVFGRKAGAVADYAYSAALRNATIVWDEASLQRWLANPEQLIPGQKMGYAVDDATDRADLIAYLRETSR